MPGRSGGLAELTGRGRAGDIRRRQRPAREPTPGTELGHVLERDLSAVASRPCARSWTRKAPPTAMHRNPLLLFVLSGVFLLRLADRRLLSLLFHDPPRRTRLMSSSVPRPAPKRWQIKT